MKTRNFPAKKTKRRLIAQGVDINSDAAKSIIEQARAKRSKKLRGVRGGGK